MLGQAAVPAGVRSSIRRLHFYTANFPSVWTEQLVDHSDLLNEAWHSDVACSANTNRCVMAYTTFESPTVQRWRRFYVNSNRTLFLSSSQGYVSQNYLSFSSPSVDYHRYGDPTSEGVSVFTWVNEPLVETPGAMSARRTEYPYQMQNFRFITGAYPTDRNTSVSSGDWFLEHLVYYAYDDPDIFE